MEDITDADYSHAKRVFKELEIKDLGGEYHDLYVQSNKLLLADIVSKYVSWNMWTWTCSFSYWTRISIVKLELLIDIDMLLMVSEEKYVKLFTDMQKLITNKWKIMVKVKNHHILNIGM